MIYQVVGLVGSFLIVYAFCLIQQKHCNMVKYNVINLTGAILLLISLIKHPNLGSVCIEIFWIIISLYGIKKRL